MQFPRWSFLIGLVVACFFLRTAASCQVAAKQQKQSSGVGVYSLTAEYVPFQKAAISTRHSAFSYDNSEKAAVGIRHSAFRNNQNPDTSSSPPGRTQDGQPQSAPKMHVVSSVPLPEVWKKMGSAQRISCSKDEDLLLRLIPASQDELGHEVARIGANGAMLGYLDLHRSPGFEKADIQGATFDSAGRIVLLARNVISADVRKTDDQGNPRTVAFRLDRTTWVLTVDDNGKILSKFSFDQRAVMGQHFALFKSGNVLVTGGIQEGQHGELIRPGAVIFSPAGEILANLKLPFTAGKRPADVLLPISGGEDEIFLVHHSVASGSETHLLKISADGTVGPQVKLAVPEDEVAYVEKIVGHRVLASIASAQRPAPGTIMKAPEWVPKAVFDTESGSLIETLLLSMHEMGPVCYSESGMTAIRTPEGTLDTLVK